MTPEILQQTDNNLADSVFEKIQTAIITGEISPGTKISEPELARAYGISRGPLREALRRLEGRNLLVHKPNVGARVVSISLVELLELYDVRDALESMACRMAARNMTDEEIKHLRSVLTQHEKQNELKQDTVYYHDEGYLDFHYCIIRGSKNSKLINVLCVELHQLVRMYRYQFGAYGTQSTDIFEDHDRIVTALENRDPEVAEILMRRHINAIKENVEIKFKLGRFADSEDKANPKGNVLDLTAT